MCRKITILIVLSLCLASLASLPVCAEEFLDIENDYKELVYDVPRDILEYLPPEIFDGFSGAESGIDASLDEGVILDFFRGIFKEGFYTAGKTLLSLFSLILISAILSCFKDVFKSEALTGALGLASSLVIVSTLVKNAQMHIKMTADVIEAVGMIVGGFVPFMATLLAMGGSGGAAVAAHGGTLMVLGVVMAVVSECFYGVVGISLAFSVAGIFGSKLRLFAISRAVRRCFGIFFGAVTSVLTFFISLKIGISAAADSVAMRGAKIFASNAIPIVGGAVGESLRTLASGLSYIKTIGGTVGILLISIAVLPTVVTVWLYRGGLVLLSGAAEMLGADREKSLIDSVVSVYGYVLAVIFIIAVVFILMLVLFMKTGLAFGGNI